jgi:hypothetical protein
MIRKRFEFSCSIWCQEGHCSKGKRCNHANLDGKRRASAERFTKEFHAGCECYVEAILPLRLATRKP